MKSETEKAAGKGSSRTAAQKAKLDKSLIEACETGSGPRIERALADGANPNAVGEEGRTALMMCVHAMIDSWWDWPKAMLAMEALVEAGAKVEIRDNLGESAATWAARLEGGEPLEWLGSKGANLLEPCPEGDTLLHEAARYASMECVEYLLGIGADARAVSRLGGGPPKTPINEAWEWAEMYGSEVALRLEEHAARMEKAQLDAAAGLANVRGPARRV